MGLAFILSGLGYANIKECMKNEVKPLSYHPDRPMIIQSDYSVLLEVKNEQFEAARTELGQFADLVKSPEFIHTYRITPLSLWNAAASGMTSDEMISVLEQYGKFELPQNIRKDIIHYVSRYGLLKLEEQDGKLVLKTDDPIILNEICSYQSLQPYFVHKPNDSSVEIVRGARGTIKQELIRLGFPVEDHAGYHRGESLPVQLREQTLTNRPFFLRDYQKMAVNSFYREGSVYGGSGVLVLPCGAGKTVIGIGTVAKLGCATLVLTTNVTSVRQWIRELLDKTNITSDLIGEYTGNIKQVKPITVATYQILTHRKSKEDEFTHMSLFNERDWGLIIYDEVHLLPAPVFRATADIQTKRRLGLTATLIREDGREEDVFTLVGAKRYDVPWKELEGKGWIAGAECTEVRVPMLTTWREKYALAEPKQKYRLASENPHKIDVVKALLRRHEGKLILVIGQYLDQLKVIADAIKTPLITGGTPHDQRDRLFDRFKRGELKTLVVSKVANFAVDLPDAAVAIQVSGTFGSRQEEAQRLGRILRSKEGDNKAYFYTVVSRDTKDQEFAMNRQLFLVEQGYRYSIQDAEAMMERTFS
jgi:DNA excision repair protein ERCC-3